MKVLNPVAVKKWYIDTLDVYLCDSDVLAALKAGTILGVLLCLCLGYLGLFNLMLGCIYFYLPVGCHYAMALTFEDAGYESELLPGIVKDFWIAGIGLFIIATVVYGGIL